MDCLVVKKVYDECSKRSCFENLPFQLMIPCGTMDDYTYLHTEFGKAQIEQYENEPFFTERGEDHACLRMVVGVPIWVVLRRRSDRATVRVAAHPIYNGSVQCDNLVRIPVRITVYAPACYLRQGRFTPYAESFVETGGINMEGMNCARLTLGFFFIIKVLSDVQLKVPNFGFCDVPPECNEEPCDVNFCEAFLDENITPFPVFFPEDR